MIPENRTLNRGIGNGNADGLCDSSVLDSFCMNIFIVMVLSQDE